MLRVGWSILLLTAAACFDARPVRLVAGRSDTVVVNSRVFSLAVRWVDANGVERPAKGVRYRLIKDDDFELTDGGLVTCGGAGDAEIIATYGNLSKRLTVLCRPIEGFRFPRRLRLAIGSPPTPLDLDAIGVDRMPVDIITATASVRDRRVAAVVEGYIHALARGETIIDVEAGDCALSILVEVFEPSTTPDGLLPYEQYAESLSMSAGEFRSWQLAPGRYEIGLFAEGGARTHLRLATYHMNCAALPHTDQQYSCIAKDRASVIVQHTQPAGQGLQSRGTLLLNRGGDFGGTPGQRDRPVVSKCPFF